MSVRLHQLIEKYNILEKPTDRIAQFLDARPTARKVVLIVNHLFRAIAMAALMVWLPFSPLLNGCICLAGSLFYRLTVETYCAYKFALPSFAGGAAIDLVRRSAVGWALLSAYAIYVILTVDYDVRGR